MTKVTAERHDGVSIQVEWIVSKTSSGGTSYARFSTLLRRPDGHATSAPSNNALKVTGDFASLLIARLIAGELSSCSSASKDSLSVSPNATAVTLKIQPL